MIRAPIFIVGSPRSGTYLLQRCLNSHPHLAILGETHFFSLVAKLAWRFGNLHSPRNRKQLIERYLGAIKVYSPCKWDLSVLGARLFREATTYPLFFQTFLQEYARQQGKARCGEKTPTHAFYLSAILRLFPDSRILHIVRDPRDVVASLKTMPWASSDVVSNALSWRRHVRSAEVHQGMPYYLRIHYEELVQSPVPVFQTICQFLDEPYFEEWSSVDSSQWPDRFGWWRARSFQPITTDRVGHWKSQLSEEEAALIEWITKSEMKALNYTPSPERRRPSWRMIAREMGRFCLYQSRQRWRSVAWNWSPDPLLYFHRWSEEEEKRSLSTVAQ